MKSAPGPRTAVTGVATPLLLAALVAAGCAPSPKGSRTVEAAGSNARFSVRLTGPDFISGRPSLDAPALPPMTLELSGPAGARVHIVGSGEPSNGCHFDSSFADVTIGSDGAATSKAVAYFGRADRCAYEAAVTLFADGRDPDTSTTDADDVARPRLEVPVR